MADFALSPAHAFGESPVLARLGTLEARLARTPGEVRAATRLRHAVFCAEMGLKAVADGIETDSFDALCDHILVRDTSLKTPEGRPPVVGTCRVLRPERAAAGFYSGAEFDLAPLFDRHAGLRFCEVGRACVARSHRAQRTLETLWRGLWAYAARHGIDVYFGAASFAGTDPQTHAMALAYLHHHVGAPPGWEVFAQDPGSAPMDAIARDAVDPVRALREMPPLLRGYLRVGAHVGRSAFIDPVFGTTDVLVVTRLSAAPAAWLRRFAAATGLGSSEGRPAVGIAPDML